MGDLPKLILKSIDVLSERNWLVIPLVYVTLIASSILLYLGYVPANWMWLAVSFLIFSASFAIVIPVHDFRENKRVRIRLLNLTESERRQTDVFIVGKQSTVNLWPHDSCVAGLWADGIVEDRPCEIGNGMRTFKLSRRASTLIKKGYYS
jgi:hypothetical protein